jgi:hypothetical protein
MTPRYSGSVLAAACHPSRVRALLANPNIPLNHVHCPYEFICLHLLCSFREQQRCPGYIEQAWIASECVVEDTRLRNVFQSTHFLRDCEALAARSPSTTVLGGAADPIASATAGTKPDPAATINIASSACLVFVDFRSCILLTPHLRPVLHLPIHTLSLA